jgi:hypothetical protein
MRLSLKTTFDIDFFLVLLPPFLKNTYLNCLACNAQRTRPTRVSPYKTTIKRKANGSPTCLPSRLKNGGRRAAGLGKNHY